MPSLRQTTLLPLILVLSPVTSCTSISCPGILNSVSSTTVCCVGGVLPPVMLSSCAGWPTCTGSVTITTTSKPISCASIIPVAISDYSSVIASEEASLKASGTHYHTTLAALDGSSAETTWSSASSAAATAGSDSSGGSEIQLHAGTVAGVLLLEDVLL